ncbi:hypothetical protein [Pantoea ananatis]|uniref:hypothetical protein n=1 Tax=Pantoea ananas TaxID=553 RepID=UPI00059E867F|nr:hypothetical protein [Pantoea ananatis]
MKFFNEMNGSFKFCNAEWLISYSESKKSSSVAPSNNEETVLMQVHKVDGSTLSARRAKQERYSLLK